MIEPLRVSFCLANSGIGGTELNAVRTAERLDPERFDLEVISLADYGPLRERYESAGIAFRVLPISSLKSADVLRQGWALARHLRERRADVFHSQDSYGNILGVPWARLAQVPAVVASRRWWKSTPRPGHKAGNRWAFRLANAVVTNTPAVAALTEREGLPREKIRVVPNFLDEDSFTPPNSAVGADLRRQFGMDPDDPIVGIVAHLRPVKDHATLLRAAARIAGRHPRVQFVLVGEGECRSDLEALRRDLGLEGRVHLAGLRHGEGNLHHLFEISVLCSKSEAFSNSILEAMAAGNPVVATDVGGNPDAVSDGQTGLLCPVGDDERLASALDRLLSDPAHGRRLGAAGRDRVRQTYTPRAALAKLERVYRRLLSERRHPMPNDAAVAA